MMTAMMSRNRPKMAFALLAGKLYVAGAFLEAVAAAGIARGAARLLLVPGDPMGAFVLAVIGAIFLYGAYELHSGLDEGVAYLYVGIALALIFGMIYLLALGASAADAALTGDVYDPLGGMRPGLYLAVVPLAGGLAWRDRFDIKGIRL